MTTYAPKKLAQSYPSNTTETTVYTTPGGRTTIVKQVIVANSSASASTASLSFVPSGGSASVSNRAFKDISVAAGQVVMFDLSQVMAAGDFISIQVGTASSSVYTISGVETLTTTFPVSGLDVSKNGGAIVGTRPEINFIEGANVTLTVADNSGSNQLDVTIASAGTGGGETDPVVFMGGF